MAVRFPPASAASEPGTCETDWLRARSSSPSSQLFLKTLKDDGCAVLCVRRAPVLQSIAADHGTVGPVATAKLSTVDQRNRLPDNIQAMPLALAKRFKVLVLCLPIAAACVVVQAVTGEHGWIAFSAYMTALYLVIRVSARYGFHIPRRQNQAR